MDRRADGQTDTWTDGEMDEWINFKKEEKSGEKGVTENNLKKENVKRRVVRKRH